MTGVDQKLADLIKPAERQFVIPVYQRNYDWKKDNCRQLYDDLIKTAKENRKSHFFGSIVSAYHNSGSQTDDFLIIDGQQRLTTVSLLLLAMYNLISSGEVTPTEPKLADKIHKIFLINEFQTGDAYYKLKPVKNDNAAYNRLFGDSRGPVESSRITANYNYFYDRIKQNEITIDELYSAINKLQIISIKLDPDDNPQLIFESLNATGLNLSEGDKIRNYVLMGQPPHKQDEYYEKYWNPVEEFTKYDVSAFVRDYLSVKQLSIPAQKDVYKEFKEFDASLKSDTKDLLDDLLAYAKRYNILLAGGTKNPALDACINRLNRLETTVTRPFFLEVLRLFDENKLNSDEVAEIFLLTENYIFRRLICDLPTNALNKIFLMLHREIERYDGTLDNYVDKFKYSLLSKKEKTRFPDDTEFAAGYPQKNVYQMTAKNKHYILERIENYKTNEDKDIYRHLEDGTYSIEHIMPQALTPSWKIALGDDYEKIHREWLHKIANLTLTGYNSSYGNKSFTEKRDAPNGLKDSGLRMNAYFNDKDEWTLAELKERSRYLTSMAQEIWPAPETSYAPPAKQLDSYTLSDGDTLTGKIIARFSYQGIEQAAESWADMYQKVLAMLYEEDKAGIKKHAAASDEPLSYYFSLNSGEFYGADIGDGVYARTDRSTASKLNVLGKLFAQYGKNPDDLVFYTRPDSDGAAAVNAAQTYKEYWTTALNAIRDKLGLGAPFANVNPSKGDWINGFFGMGGFSISCCANNSFVRVQLYLGNNDKEKNKKAFDKLYAKKVGIERELGTALEWNRRDDIVSSNITLTLGGASLANSDDWPRMADFHAEWSKKFYDVLVRELKD